jgi:hypothetical protein
MRLPRTPMDKLDHGAFTAGKQLTNQKKCRDKHRGIFVCK